MTVKIGEFLRQIREKNGAKGFWSLNAVAQRAGISHSYLSQLETGQVKQPLPDILKKLANALRIPYEDLLRAANYLPPEPPPTKTIKIPVLGEVPAGEINWVLDEVQDWIEINWDFIRSKNTFALRVKGNCLKGAGISDKDIIIVSKSQKVENGDIAVIRIEDECTCRKVFFQEKQIILQPVNEDYEPIVIKAGDKKIEIIGRVIRALKKF